MKLLKNIFSIRNDREMCRKIITFLGIKISVKSAMLKLEKLEYKLNEIIYNQRLIKTKMAQEDDIYNIQNAKIYCPNFPLDSVQTKIVTTQNFYEIDLLNRLDDEIPQNAVILDIGANIGNHTLYWTMKSPRNVQKVYSFEPVKETFYKLSKNIELNNLTSKVKLFNVGLSDENVTGSIGVYNLSNIGGTNVLKDNDGGLVLKRLDDIEITENHVDFIKIDVENHELFALNGAINTIKKYKPAIFIEVWADYKIEEVKKFFKDLNYELIEAFEEYNYLFKYKG